MARTRGAAWLTAVFGLGVLLLLLSALPGSGDLEARGTTLVAPLSQGIRDAVRPVADVVLRSGQIQELTTENTELRQTVERLEAELALLREEQITARQRTALIESVGAEDADRYRTAAVLLHDPTAAREIVVLDLGRADGVAPGQPVLGPGATLVGMVIDVDERTSRARLLSDADSAVAALVQGTRTQGALAGGRDGLRLELVPVDNALDVGDVVLTSALGGRLPGGLLIGRISSVVADERALFAEITVEPVADYSRLEQVLILTDYRGGVLDPARDETTPGDTTADGAATGEESTEDEAAEEGAPGSATGGESTQ